MTLWNCSTSYKFNANYNKHSYWGSDCTPHHHSLANKFSLFDFIYMERNIMFGILRHFSFYFLRARLKHKQEHFSKNPEKVAVVVSLEVDVYLCKANLLCLCFTCLCCNLPTANSDSCPFRRVPKIHFSDIFLSLCFVWKACRKSWGLLSLRASRTLRSYLDCISFWSQHAALTVLFIQTSFVQIKHSYQKQILMQLLPTMWYVFPKGKIYDMAES